MGSARTSVSQRAPQPAVVVAGYCAAAAILTGCWTAPNAYVQPVGEPRLIQSGIAVNSVKNRAIVQAVDPQTRTLTVFSSVKAPSVVYRVGPKVANFNDLRVGETVEVTVAEQLSIYVLRDGQLPTAQGTLETIAVDAKVLSADPSYRLLTLQYPNGQTETFKVGLDIKLGDMGSGNAVVIHRGEAVAVRLGKRRLLGM